MITPKRAAELTDENAASATRPPAIAASALEPMIDMTLVFHGRAAVSSSAAPPPGAVLAVPKVVVEIDRRYRAAGWVTRLDSGTLLIETPVRAPVSTTRVLDLWSCKACGAVNRDVPQCGGCRSPRASAAR